MSGTIFTTNDTDSTTTQKITSEGLDAFRGRDGFMAMGDLQVAVNVIDARLRFGHVDLRVTPITGDGEQWVEQHRVVLN